MAVMMILMVVWMVTMGPHDGHADRGQAPAVHQEAAEDSSRSENKSGTTQERQQ